MGPFKICYGVRVNKYHSSYCWTNISLSKKLIINHACLQIVLDNELSTLINNIYLYKSIAFKTVAKLDIATEANAVSEGVIEDIRDKKLQLEKLHLGSEIAVRLMWLEKL